MEQTCYLNLRLIGLCIIAMKVMNDELYYFYKYIYIHVPTQIYIHLYVAK